MKLNIEIEEVIDKLFFIANKINSIVYISVVVVGISAVMLTLYEYDPLFLIFGFIAIIVLIIQGFFSKILLLSLAHLLQKVNVIANILIQSNL